MTFEHFAFACRQLYEECIPLCVDRTKLVISTGAKCNGFKELMQAFQDQGCDFSEVREVELDYRGAVRMLQYSLYIQAMQELCVIAAAVFPGGETIVLPHCLVDKQAFVDTARFCFCEEYLEVKFV